MMIWVGFSLATIGMNGFFNFVQDCIGLVWCFHDLGFSIFFFFGMNLFFLLEQVCIVRLFFRGKPWALKLRDLRWFKDQWRL